jgi:hypothetical protein
MTKQINGDKLFVIDPHPATPPSDQLKKWEDKWFDEEEHADVLLIQAFQAGADQELEACCEWFQEFYKTESWVKHDLKHFRAARRPKPPSLKEQALKALGDAVVRGDNFAVSSAIPAIRRALEALPE